MDNLYDDGPEDDFSSVQKFYWKREIVKKFILKGVLDLENLNYDRLAHLVIDIKNRVGLHCFSVVEISDLKKESENLKVLVN